MSSPYLITHCRLVTSDLDQAREHVGRMWEEHRSQLRKGRTYGLRWHQAGIGRSSLSYIHSASAIDLRCGTLTPVFRFTMPEEGSTVHSVDGIEAESTPGTGVVYAAGQDLQLKIEPFRSLLLSLDGDLVYRALARRFDAAPRTLPPRALDLRARPGATLRSLCRWLGRELDRPETPLASSPRVVASVERSLLTLFLDCLEVDSGLVRRRDQDTALRHLRLMEEWLDQHFAEPIGIEDMAEVAGVSPRSVETIFRRIRGCKPTEAILERRLRHAHERLREAEPGTTVADVAHGCGFFHLGRFASRYAQTFGEAPSSTLAR